MALKVLGTGTFGVDATAELAQSASITENVDIVEATNKDGDVVGVALVKPSTEKTLEVLASEGDEPPAIGEAYEGGFVIGRTKNTVNSDFQRWSVTVRIWPEISGESSVVTG